MCIRDRVADMKLTLSTVVQNAGVRGDGAGES